MSEQIRNALFNALGDISQHSLLDAYAGSGAVAFEALSRGAAPVYAIEKDPRVFKTLKNNRDSIDDERMVEVSRANCTSWVESRGLMFDYIIADPPYSELSIEQLSILAVYLSSGGVLAISHDTDKTIEIADLKLSHIKTYGNASLSFFTKDQKA